ncbi:MAG: 50S ribosome-binding GTPase [Candidatus Aminicenantes bacterium]|nr:MAG: 50S ribosome-binding GTPase [Candidatus Aminicenantes bacterium]
MPANLPPQYFEKEKELKKAKTPQERIAIIEELLAIVPKHKGTEKLQALLKTKIAKLKIQGQKSSAGARHTATFQVEKTGAGQVIVIGSPNTGKSSLIKALTNAHPEIGNYPFTTRLPSPAMMPYENIQIQLVDMPPITQDYFEFWQAELIKGADAILLVLDLSLPDPAEDILTLLAKLEEKRIGLFPQEHPIPPDKQQFMKKTMIIANKCDHPRTEENLEKIKSFIDPGFTPISISIFKENTLEYLRKQIYILLDVIRVYSKIPGKKVDHSDPFVFKKGSSLMDMAKAVHKDFAQKLKYARIWGKNKYQGQKVNRSYILEDEDIIELHL